MSDERAFDQAMRQLYLDAKDAGYNATYFLRMLNELGGVATAKKLVGSAKPAEGFTKLWEMDKLELSVEALVLDDRWKALFTDDELRAAHQRLAAYGWPAAHDITRPAH